MIRGLKLFLLYLLVVLNSVTAEEYNLFGLPGQGYILGTNVGHPYQQFNVLIDTGSSSFAIASQYRSDVATYFHAGSSNTIHRTGQMVKAKFTEGDWSAELVSDLVQFPSLNTPPVRTDIALITKAHNFFMNGSGWQGILGLAYPAVAARDSGVAGPWLNALDEALGQTAVFSIKLCGGRSATNASHYGKFEVYETVSSNTNKNTTFCTPVLLDRWYEIGLLSVRVIKPHETNQTEETSRSTNVINTDEVYISRCKKLNEKTSIVDSGTTNLRLPSDVFRQVVDELRSYVRRSNILILQDEFWYQGEAACWPQPQEWLLPRLALDILSADSDNQYFTIELPPKNYMRLVSVQNATGSVAQMCYKFGLEAGDAAVVGVVALEGTQVTFDRRSGLVGFQTSNCGPSVRITGPHNASSSLRAACGLHSPRTIAGETVQVAQWTVLAALTVAAALVLYLLAPCIRERCENRLRRMPAQMSLSRTALVT